MVLEGDPDRLCGSSHRRKRDKREKRGLSRMHSPEPGKITERKL
jgi:hypothetical protein